jgi:hypothetical protein
MRTAGHLPGRLLLRHPHYQQYEQDDQQNADDSSDVHFSDTPLHGGRPGLFRPTPTRNFRQKKNVRQAVHQSSPRTLILRGSTVSTPGLRVYSFAAFTFMNSTSIVQGRPGS